MQDETGIDFFSVIPTTTDQRPFSGEGEDHPTSGAKKKRDSNRGDDDEPRKRASTQEPPTSPQSPASSEGGARQGFFAAARDIKFRPPRKAPVGGSVEIKLLTRLHFFSLTFATNAGRWQVDRGRGPAPARHRGEARGQELEETFADLGQRAFSDSPTLIASQVRSDVQCLHRWNKVLRPGLSKGPWTAEEDKTVKEMVLTHGAGNVKWSIIAAQLPGRIGKQCRERWFNHLDPEIKKGDWALEEDEILFRTQRLHGNRWSEIAKLLPGRTENAVKNRWNSSARKRWLKDNNLTDFNAATSPSSVASTAVVVNQHQPDDHHRDDPRILSAPKTTARVTASNNTTPQRHFEFAPPQPPSENHTNHANNDEASSFQGQQPVLVTTTTLVASPPPPQAQQPPPQQPPPEQPTKKEERRSSDDWYALLDARMDSVDGPLDGTAPAELDEALQTPEVMEVLMSLDDDPQQQQLAHNGVPPAMLPYFHNFLNVRHLSTADSFPAAGGTWMDPPPPPSSSSQQQLP